MSFRPRNPLGENHGAVASQSSQAMPRLGGGAIQAKRFGATPRKALGDLGNIVQGTGGSGGLKENAKKPTPLLVVTGGRGVDRTVRPQENKTVGRRSRMLQDELVGGLHEWADDDSGDDDIEVEHMHAPSGEGRQGYDNSPWPDGNGPADGFESLLQPWPVQGGRGRNPTRDQGVSPSFDAPRSQQHSVDTVLDDGLDVGFDDVDGSNITIAVDIPFDINLE